MQLPFERKNIYFLLYLLIIPALLFSKGFLSICSIALAFLAVFSYSNEQNSYLGINPIIKNPRKLFNKSIPFAGIIILFFWMILSGIWSQDLSMYGREINAKLLLLIVPLQFILGPQLSSKQVLHLHYFYYGILSFCCLLVIGVYLTDTVAINESLKRGKSVPTPIDHIRFSMMLAYGCLSIIAFLIKKINRPKKEKIFLISVSLFFFTMLHLLAVRTGIALLYSGFLFLIAYTIIRQKKYLQGVILLGLIILTPLVAYWTIPTIQNKVKYTLLDYSVWSNNENVKDSYSDNDRMLSMQIGMEVWSKNWILGAGAGDYNTLVLKEYEKKYSARRKLLPHNQYIRTGIAYGLVGVLLLIVALVLPLFAKSTKRNLLFLLFIALYAISFLVESNLERYYSLGFFLYFFGWLLMIDPKDKSLAN